MKEISFEKISSDVAQRTNLRNFLISKFNALDVFLTGRGASAIYVALKALGKPDSFVAIPSLSCPSITLSVIAAGMKPLYLDVNFSDFNLDASQIDFLPSSVSALIAPHMFGHPLDIERIKYKCNERGIILIEDIAQSFGGKVNGIEMGKFGDFTIMSFHPSKIIPGRGGGALIVNLKDGNIHEKIKREIRQLPSEPREYLNRSKEISMRVNGILNIARDGRGGEESIRQTYLDNLDLLAYSHDASKEVANLNAVISIDETIRLRIERSEKYRKKIKHPLVKHPRIRNGSPLFRHSILIDGDKGPALCEILTEKLRNSLIHASNLYYPAHLIFDRDSKRRLHNSEWVSGRITNLWLDDNADDEYIQKSADIIEETLGSRGNLKAV